jgi:hypothetical protein
MPEETDVQTPTPDVTPQADGQTEAKTFSQERSTGL